MTFVQILLTFVAIVHIQYNTHTRATPLGDAIDNYLPEIIDNQEWFIDVCFRATLLIVLVISFVGLKGWY